MLALRPFLSETITTDEQREAFETIIIRYLDGISIVRFPSDVQQYLDEIREKCADAVVTQKRPLHFAAAMVDLKSIFTTTRKMLSNNIVKLQESRNIRHLPPTDCKNI